ncbi:MAG: hypothetical protein USCAAHI_00136 [Beijerinckiaceae bacterium]|nr:MAG: hypothetical protein USCAAHI_00136 [Beijerinckiaceae bacterium]
MASLGAAIFVASPAVAFRGGGGFGGMHGGGMHMGGVPGGGMHFSGDGFPGGMVTGRSVFVPGGGRFVGAPFAGQRFVGNRFNNFAFRRNAFFFRHHHFRNFAVVGAPFFYDYAAYGNGCWRQVWTSYGWSGPTPATITATETAAV